jgi:hypothetical protein
VPRNSSLFAVYIGKQRTNEIILIELGAFWEEIQHPNRVDVKKIVTIVFLAEIFCLVLGTTSLAEVANIESLYVV